MHKKPVGGDGTFDLESTIRILDGVETKFGQAYVLTNKDEQIAMKIGSHSANHCLSPL